MKLFKQILFIIAFLAIPVGLFFKINLLSGGGLLLCTGLLGFFLYYIAKTIKDLVKKRNEKINITLQICIVLMSVIFFSKYQFYRFGDCPGLFIIPLFIFTAILYLVKGRYRDNKLISVSILYLILSIPLFCFDFNKSPRKYIPQEWTNRYDISGRVAITLPYEYKYPETEQLREKAYQLKSEEYYYEAMLVYNEARKIEPENPWLLFDLSEVYARTNHLETATALLDTAIMLNGTIAAFYGNRGLLHYKLKENSKAINDYLKAVQIDSINPHIYINLALVYYFENEFDRVCESIAKAERLGGNVNADKFLSMIKRKYCDAK